MLPTRATTLLATMLAAAATAQAEIVVDDPAGDVDVQGLPIGAGGEAYDLRQIRIDVEGDHLVARITLESAPGPHDSAEFGVVFTGNGTWMTGYTALPYTDPPPRYQGGFACPATHDGFVNGSQSQDCIGVADWNLEGATYVVRAPIGFFGAGPETVLHDAWGFSEVSPYLKGGSRVDVTQRSPPVADDPGEPAGPLPSPDRESPVPGFAGPAAVVAAAALRLRLKRRWVVRHGRDRS